mmetsp:Transcript_154/g.402  ORF Transcript_154/g.402 Transcript_154/m.402 type:complete len:206 (+) Transcript_154:101-718(+)
MPVTVAIAGLNCIGPQTSLPATNHYAALRGAICGGKTDLKTIAASSSLKTNKTKFSADLAISQPVPEDDSEIFDTLLYPSESNVVAKPGDDYEGSCGDVQSSRYLVRLRGPDIHALIPDEDRRADAPDESDVFTNYGSRLIDLKGVGRFPPFTGLEADWPEWRFRFQVCADLIDLGDSMELAEKEFEEIELDNMLPDQQTPNFAQ